MFDLSSFLNPSLLWLAAAAAAPILIHLMARSRPKPTPFPAVRFILASHRKSSTKFKLKQLLLLLMRIAVLGLFALVVARPWTKGTAADVTYAKAEVTAVVLLDTSYSMGHRKGGASALDRAKKMALDAVDAFTEGSPICLFTVGDTPRPIISDFKHAFDVESLRKSVRDEPLAYRGTNCTAALKQALAMLKEANGVGKSVFLFTDLTDRSWPSALPRDDKAEDVTIYVCDVGTTAPVNPAVLGVEAPANAIAGTSFPVTARVDATGAAGCQVQLVIDGSKADEKPASAHKPENVPLIGSAAKAAPEHWGRVSVTGHDGLRVDNAYTFSFRSRATVKIALVNGAPSSVPRRDELFFLRLALAPGGIAVDEPLQFVELTPAQLESSDLSDVGVVALCNVANVSTSAWTKLRHFVSTGHGLMVFGGDRVNSAAYDAVSKGGIALLPCSLGAPVIPDGGTQLEPGRLKHRVVRLFREASYGDLAANGLRFGKYLKLAPNKHVSHEVVLAFKNGDPALVAGQYRAGRVLVFASSCDADWSTFPRYRAPYPVLMHESMKFLASAREERRDVRVGAAPALQIRAPETVRKITLMRLGDGAPTDVTDRLRRVERRGELDLPVVERPGVYRVAVTRGAGDGAEEMFLAANLDTTESNLTRLADDGRMEEALQALLPGRKVRLAHTSAELLDHLSRSESVAELASHLAGILLAILIAEMYLSNRMRTRVNDEAEE